MSSGEDVRPDRTEIVHVDLSRIMEYISPDELERYENEQFKIEAEAEAIAMRAEAEETARRWLEKNARVPGAGKGGRMLNGLGLDTEARARGRSRGRGRGRGRGSRHGRGPLALSSQLHNQDTDEILVDIEETDTLLCEEEDLQLMVAKTESEEDSEGNSRVQTSPLLARSAFVANSALPVSPVASLRRPSGIPIIQRARYQDADDDTDLELNNADARSVSSAAMPRRTEDDFRGRVDDTSEEDNPGRDRHSSKRRRTESPASNRRTALAGATIPLLVPQRTFSRNSFVPPTRKSCSSASANSDESKPPQVAFGGQSNGTDQKHALPHAHNSTADPLIEQHGAEESDDEDDEAEEYVVEDIIEHYHDAGRKYYLVRWQGYEDSHDWLPEEDLEGAAELVTDYNERFRKKEKGKEKLTS